MVCLKVKRSSPNLERDRKGDSLFLPFDRFQEQFEPPLWKGYLAEGIRKGHGGTDFLELRAFKECIKRKINTPIDVYDMAAWMAISPLSEQSIRRSSAPVDFPEFTQGKWMSNPPWFGFTQVF